MEANQEKDRGEVQRERDRRHKIEVGERSPRDRLQIAERSRREKLRIQNSKKERIADLESFKYEVG